MEKKKYTPVKTVTDAKEKLETHSIQKPGSYNSQWQGQADGVLSEIKNRGPFAYDAARDPNYRQAVDQYVRLGRKAMMDTQGRAAAMTGGYGNSYAQAAGQQTYGEYLQALASRMPQFQDMAMKRYELNGKQLMDRYHALSDREKAAYDRYEKTLQQYWAEHDRLQNTYDREQDRDTHRYESDRDYEFATEKDARDAAARAEQARLEQERWEKDLKYKTKRDQIRDEQWERQFEENRRRYEREWAARHSGSGGHGSSGGSSHRSPPSTNVGSFQGKNDLTEGQFDHRYDDAQQNGHVNTRPSGEVWNPSQKPGRKPIHSVDLTH